LEIRTYHNYNHDEYDDYYIEYYYHDYNYVKYYEYDYKYIKYYVYDNGIKVKLNGS